MQDSGIILLTILIFPLVLAKAAFYQVFQRKSLFYLPMGHRQLFFYVAEKIVYLFFHFAGRFSIIAVMPSWKSSVRSKMLL